MKFYFAVQHDADVDLEWEDLQYELEQSKIVIAGNRHFVSCNEHLLDEYEDFICDAEDVEDELELASMLHDFLGKDFTDEQLTSFKKLLDNSEATYADFLTIFEDEAWHQVCIRGYCQSDWQYVLCPVSYDTKYVEAVYFGRGYSYEITEDSYEEAPDFSSVGVYWCFIPEYEDAKEFLAREIGCTVDEVKVGVVDYSYVQVVHEFFELN
jgi:hypothetical protein